MNILVTGGAGYIGSITNRTLIEAGHKTIVFDNLSSGYADTVPANLIVGDLRNKQDIHKVFSDNHIDIVVHFAAKALAGESMKNPYEYYENNVLGGLNLVEVMREHNCKKIIFSSTCAVYGYPDTLPVTEEEKINPESVYGSSKRMFEEVLEWYETVYGIRHVILRYFNAAGAALDGSLGERHVPETHIIPIALDVALGKKPAFSVFGNDYDTADGTCVRDYIHVLDLAIAHKQAAEYLDNREHGSVVVNLGAGKGYSNLEILETIEQVTGKKVNRKIEPRRPGDPACIYARTDKAKTVLGWTPQYSDINTIIESAWKWHVSLEGVGPTV